MEFLLSDALIEMTHRWYEATDKLNIFDELKDVTPSYL